MLVDSFVSLYPFRRTCTDRSTCKIAAHAIYGIFFFSSGFARSTNYYYSFFAFANDFYGAPHTHSHIPITSRLISLTFIGRLASTNFRKATTPTSDRAEPKKYSAFHWKYSALQMLDVPKVNSGRSRAIHKRIARSLSLIAEHSGCSRP